MKVLWLCRDTAYQIFDTKESSDILGCPKSSWAKEVELTDEEYARYKKVTEDYFEFQEFLEARMLK